MYRQLYLLPFLLIVGVGASAQRERITSAPVTEGDTTSVNSLVERAALVRSTNPGMATEYCLTALKIARQLKYLKGEGRALGALGWTYYTTGNFVDAVENCYAALRISEKANDKIEMARSHANIGALDFQQKHPERAMDHFKKALALSTQAGDKRTMARSMNNIGSMFQISLNPKTDSARAYIEKALFISLASGDQNTAGISYHILGDLYLQDGNYTEAITHFEKSLAVSDKMSDAMKIDTRNQIAEAYLRQHKTTEALKILKLTSVMAKNAHARDQVANSYRLFAQLHKQKGEFKEALVYQERYTNLKDSIHRDDVSARLASTQTQSDLDIKQKQIELLTKDTMLNKDEITRQRTQLYTMIGGFIGILFLAGVLVFSYQRIERTNVLLNQRTAELARINTTKDKLFSIISHDFRSPMNSLKGLLSLLENKNLTPQEFAMLAEKLTKNFNAVSNDLENLLQWSMAQLQGIQTNSVKIDVQPIVDEHIVVFQELAKAKNVRISNKIQSGLYGLADEDHIRLVLRNLINNAIKFTPPGGTVEISGFQDEPFITIQVTDTGVGIASEQIETLFHKDRSVSTRGTNQEKGVGLGLLLCAEFVENNGGQLNVASQIGKGSVFSFTLRAA